MDTLIFVVGRREKNAWLFKDDLHAGFIIGRFGVMTRDEWSYGCEMLVLSLPTKILDYRPWADNQRFLLVMKEHA